MIQLECSNCRTNLSIDDAFAGGVCRCQHCGTIQTVPKAGAAAVVTATQTKQLFKRKARIESALNPFSDNLDRAADEIDSSGGLSANSLANVAGARRSGPTPDDSTNGVPVPPVSATPPATPSAAATPAANKPYYVPRPSNSSATPAQGPASEANKTMLIGIVAVIAMILLGGGAWFAFSGTSDDAGSNKNQPAHVAPAVPTR